MYIYTHVYVCCGRKCRYCNLLYVNIRKCKMQEDVILDLAFGFLRDESYMNLNHDKNSVFKTLFSIILQFYIFTINLM